MIISRSLHLKHVVKLPAAFFVLSLPLTSIAQSQFNVFANLFTIPKSYVVTYTKTPPIIDGDINDPAWQQAVGALPGYALSHPGDVLSLVRALPWWHFRKPKA